MREFHIKKNPNQCGNLYSKSDISFEPGITVLVGCNGCGKTSLIKQIKISLEKEDIPYVYYDNLSDGGSNARNRAGFYGNFDFLATSFCSSEGENIVLNMGNIASEMGALTRDNPEAKELWFLLDAVDSGLSIDNVVDMKEQLFSFVIEYNKGKDVYILITANAYEMCRGEKCFDTYAGQYIDFSSYEDYRNFILKSGKRKQKREESLRKRRKSKKL